MKFIGVDMLETKNRPLDEPWAGLLVCAWGAHLKHSECVRD